MKRNYIYKSLFLSSCRGIMLFGLLFLCKSLLWGQSILINQSPAGTLKAGDVVTYTVTATNTSAAMLTGVNISHPLPNAPAVLVPNSLWVSGTDLTCSVPSSISNSISISGFNLLPDERIIYSFQVKIPANYSGTSSISHTASFNSGAATATSTNAVSAIPALSITKVGTTQSGSASVNPLGVMKYRITLSNTGTAEAQSVVLKDGLDTLNQVKIFTANAVSVDLNYAGSYVVNKGNALTDDSVNVSLGTIPAGGMVSVEFQVRLKASATGTLNNIALATASNLTGGVSTGTVSSLPSSTTINAAADCANRNIYYLSFNGNDATAEVNNPNRPWQTFYDVIEDIDAAGGNAIVRFLDAYYPTSVSGSTAPTLNSSCVTIDGNYCIFDRNSGASVGFLNVEGNNDTIRNLRLTNFNKSPDCSFNITGTALAPIRGFHMDDVWVYATQLVKATTFTNVEWATINNCEWSNNPYGAMDITDSKIIFTNTDYNCNERPGAGGGDGGAVYARTSGTSPETNKTVLRFEGCSFYGNRTPDLAGDGGAIYAENNITMRIENSTFLNNYSNGTSAGAIRLGLTTNTVIVNSTFKGNYNSEPTGLGGGAIYVAGTSGSPSTYPYLSILSSEFDENWGPNGGAINAAATNLKIKDSYFQKNVAASGSTYPSAGTGRGGAIYLWEHEYNNFDFLSFAANDPNLSAPSIPNNQRMQYMGADSSMWIYNGANYVRAHAAVRDSFVNNIFADSPDRNLAGANGGACIFTGGGSGGAGNYKGVNLYGTNNTLPSAVFLNLSPNAAPSSVLGNGQVNDWTETDQFNRPAASGLGASWNASASGVTINNSGTLGALRMTSTSAATLYASRNAIFTSLANGSLKSWAFSVDQTGFNSTNFGYCVLTSTHSDPSNVAASGYAIKVLAQGLQFGKFTAGLASFTNLQAITVTNTDLYLNCVVTFNPSTKIWNFYKGEERGINSDPREVYTTSVGVGASPGSAYTPNATYTLTLANDLTASTFPFTGFAYTTSGSATKNVLFDDFWIGEDASPANLYAYTAPILPLSCPSTPTSANNCISFYDLGDIRLTGCKFLNTYTGDFASATPILLDPTQSLTASVLNFYPVNSPANVYEWRYLVVNAANEIVQVITPSNHLNVSNTSFTPNFSTVSVGTYSVYGYYFNTNSTSAPLVGTNLAALAGNSCGTLSNSAATFEVLAPIVETVNTVCEYNGARACPNRYFATVTVSGGYPQYTSANGISVPQYVLGIDSSYLAPAYTNEMTGWASLGQNSTYIDNFTAATGFGVKTEADGNCNPYPFALNLAAEAPASSCSILINGTVYNDPDGGDISGTGIANPSGVQLYAYLISTSGTPSVVAMVAINPDGTYSFTAGFAPDMPYTVYLSTNGSLPIGSTTLPGLSLPSTGSGNWTNTAEGLTAAGDGTANGIIPIISVSSNSVLNNVDFAITPPPVFPITLLSFEGHWANQQAVLEWISASEVNASHFELMYSSDAKNYQKIATIQAQGNSQNLQSYHFLHPTSQEQNYYQLKMIDQDGTFTYSPIILLTATSIKKGTLLLLPNPARNFVEVQHPSADDFSSLILCDIRGRVLKQIEVSPQQQKTSLEIQGLASGIYQIIWRDGTSTFTEKLIVE